MSESFKHTIAKKVLRSSREPETSPAETIFKRYVGLGCGGSYSEIEGYDFLDFFSDKVRLWSVKDDTKDIVFKPAHIIKAIEEVIAENIYGKQLNMF